MTELTLTATTRESVGKASKALRKQGFIPAVAYGRGIKTDSLSLNGREVTRLYNEAGTSKLVLLKIDGAKARNVIFHDVQLDGRTGDLLHVDLYVVRMDETLKAEVPLHFVGESTAVYQDEGSLMHGVESVEIECLPSDLPEMLEVDISVLDDFEKTITLADVKLPAGVTFTAEEPEAVMVAKVDAPRSDEELEDLEAPIDEASEIPANAQEEQPAVVSEENEGDADRRDKK